MDKTVTNGTTPSKDTAPDLAAYQAQWTKIHNETIRQIERVREQEQHMRSAQQLSKTSRSSSVN
ncbi:hypothetical protein BJX96DRAFT_175667 [Aspergillus floccosus]